jgi:hypothetical protein
MSARNGRSLLCRPAVLAQTTIRLEIAATTTIPLIVAVI